LTTAQASRVPRFNRSSEPAAETTIIGVLLHLPLGQFVGFWAV
jgi:hypothetical protein